MYFTNNILKFLKTSIIPQLSFAGSSTHSSGFDNGRRDSSFIRFNPNNAPEAKLVSKVRDLDLNELMVVLNESLKKSIPGFFDLLYNVSKNEMKICMSKKGADDLEDYVFERIKDVFELNQYSYLIGSLEISVTYT